MSAVSDASGDTGRRAARRTAMMVLYQMDLLKRDVDTAVQTFEQENGFPLSSYSRQLVQQTGGSTEQLDELIRHHLRDDWSVDRLGVVERAILRMSFHEIRSESVPVPVAIDEAVELARRYASPEASRLVNGVLASYAASIDEEQ